MALKLASSKDPGGYMTIGAGEFPATSMADWAELARKALKGASLDDALVSRTDDGVAIQPLYARRPDFAPQARRNSGWIAIQRADDTDPRRANRQILDDLEGGAGGISLVFEGAANAFGHGLPCTSEALAAVLGGVDLGAAHIRIDSHPQSRHAADWLAALLTARRAPPKQISLSFGIDPAAVFSSTGRLRMSLAAIEESLPQSLSHFFALGVPGVLLEADGRVYHNGGATEAQELGAMLAGAVSHLRMFEKARQPLVYAAPHIGFAMSLDQDLFLSMAKIRALRLLWARVQEACGFEPADAVIHAETSWRMLTFKDPETNILRNTLAAFAAAAGGADSLSVLPHTLTHGLPDAFARRVARNTQLVLAEEAAMGRVSDPASGSGGIEALTEALCEAAWGEFQTIQREGGILQSLAAGALQGRIARSRAKRLAEYADGKRVIVGTTRFAASSERPVAVLEAGRREPPTDGAVFCERIPAHRIDAELSS